MTPDGFLHRLRHEVNMDVEDAGDAVDDRFVAADREDADGNVQIVGECRDLPRAAVGPKIFQDLHRIARRSALFRGKWILHGIGDPQTPALIEGDVDRLMNIRLGSHELNGKPRRQMKRRRFIGRLARAGWHDEFRRISLG